MNRALTADTQAALDRVLALEGTPEDHARVAQWIGSDAARAAWVAALRASIDVDPPAATWDVERGLARVKSRRTAQTTREVPWRGRWLGAALGAAAASLVLIGSGWWRTSRVPSSIGSRLTMRAPVGDIHRARLTDGSTVVLSPGSSLTYVDRGDRREVELVGRASFEVAADSARPFDVRAAFGTVTVLGTGFEVAAYDNETPSTVLVRHGRVAVRRAARDSATVLGAREQLEIDGDQLRLMRAIDTTVASAWRDGRLVFRDVPVALVARELTRWGRPLLVSPALGDRRVTMTVHVATLSTAPQQLALALDAGLRGDSLVLRVR
jgi:transmembrane sensor